MEDRYLFRAKRIDNGEWAEGMPFEIEGKTMMLIRDDENLLRTHYLDENMWNAEIYCVEVDPSTICRCIGSRDKNSKLIWENDIVKYRVYQRTERLYKVIYDYEEGSWSLGCNSEPLYSIGGANSEKCEVVGNAFDNPELLEV